MSAAESIVGLGDATRSFLGSTRKMLIGGQWVESASGKCFDVKNPATEEVIARVPEGESEDIDRAVKAARKAFESGPWATMTPSERSKVIWKVGDLILENLEELAQLESLDNGKPVAVARAADVPLAADIFHYMAGWCTRIKGRTIPLSVLYTPGAQYHSYTRKEPIGVVGQIIPWNFPLLMASWKLGPALACGCTVVLKIAEETPLTGLRLGELIEEAGIPAGVVNIISGFGETAGAALAAHPGVDKVAFTGSTEVGKLIVKAASYDLKKVSLELGGKSPNLVLDDADMDVAISGAANAIFFNHGQCCCAGSMLYVHKNRFDEVVAGVSDIASKIKVGHGLAEDTEMGPMVSEIQHQRVSGYLESGLEDGANAVVGGHKGSGKGYFIEPTVLTDTTGDMKVVKEEIFGPVVIAAPFSGDEATLIAQANNTDYGLAAGVWTTDISKGHRIAAGLRSGTVWVNCYNIFDSALPFGGYKQSGWGREMGEEVLGNYLETKAVTVHLT